MQRTKVEAVDCPVYARNQIAIEHEIEGPAVIGQMDSTPLVLPGQKARRDRHGNLVLTFTS